MYAYDEKRHKKSKKIIERVNSDERILVEFNDRGWYDGFLEKGMRAYLVFIGSTDIYEYEDEESNFSTQFFFEFESFETMNKEIEIKLFPNKETYYPIDHKEDFYLSETHADLPFDIIKSGSSSFYQRYKNSKSKLSYTSWLEQQLLKSRHS